MLHRGRHRSALRVAEKKSHDDRKQRMDEDRRKGEGVAAGLRFSAAFLAALSCGREPVDFTRQKGWAPISTWPRLCPPTTATVVARQTSACLETSFTAKQQQFLETEDEIV